MEASSLRHDVVNRSAHGRRLHNHLRPVSRWRVSHIGPNPVRPLVVGTEVIASDKFDPELVIVALGLWEQVIVGPCDRFIIYVSAPIANFILHLKRNISASSAYLYFLPRTHFALHFRCRLRMVSRVHWVVIAVVVLGHSHCIYDAIFRINFARCVDFGKMHGIGLLNIVEVVV